MKFHKKVAVEKRADRENVIARERSGGKRTSK
jgi:hypothetical protein